MPVPLLRSTSLRSIQIGCATGGGPSARIPRCVSTPLTPRSIAAIDSSSVRAKPPDSIVSAGLPRVIAVFER